jgi:alcohol dehydrogenase
VFVFGRHAEKLSIARQAGASASQGAPAGQFPIVVESTGSAEGLRCAVGIVRPRGTVVMKSTVHEEVKIDMAPVIVNEITLLGSRCGLFEPALRLLREGKINTDAMVTAEYPLSEAPAAFARAAERGVLKVLLRNTQTS